MADLGGFDANDPKNKAPSNALPKGEYKAVLVKSERKATSAGDGFYLDCDFQIVSGEFQNKHIFHKLNLWLHPSKSQAIQIAKGQLSELCRAVGVPNPKDSSDLHNKAVIIKLTVKESAGTACKTT